MTPRHVPVTGLPWAGPACVAEGAMAAVRQAGGARPRLRYAGSASRPEPSRHP